MKVFNNIKVAPYQELLDNPKGLSFHRGGPLWPDWERCCDERHRIGGRTVDHLPVVSGVKSWKKFDQPAGWCGAICGHFGHQITDFTSRILSYRKLGVKYAFGVHPGLNIKGWEDCPGYFKSILAWLGVDKSSLILVDEYTVFKELYCAPQAEQLGGVPPSRKYLDDLSDVCERNLQGCGKRGLVYVSRAAQSSGVLAGESYIERFLGECGIGVVRPEVISLEEQLRIYSSSENIIFSEGSAVHGMQLLGRGNGKVHVLNRRSGSSIGKNLLEPRCRQVKYYDVGELAYGLNLAGNPAPELGITIASSESMMSAFKEIGGGVDISLFDSSYFNFVVERDVSKWLAREKASPRSRHPNSISMARKKIDKAMSKLSC